MEALVGFQSIKPDQVQLVTRLKPVLEEEEAIGILELAGVVTVEAKDALLGVQAAGVAARTT
jgi:hypothetical protein